VYQPKKNGYYFIGLSGKRGFEAFAGPVKMSEGGEARLARRARVPR
jgi:hypothetical protein